MDIRVVNSEKKKTILNGSSFITQLIFGNGLLAIQKFKTTLTLNKLAYVGTGILQLRKIMNHKLEPKTINK